MESYYALRRLSPFQGTLQVVEVPEGRALSADGRRWQVEILTRAAVRQPLWGEIGPASAERRYFTFGMWSAAGGLQPAPVNPLLGDQCAHPALPELIRALEHMPALPFALEDRLELWLLRASDMAPLALLKSLRASAAPPLAYVPAWRPMSLSESGFESASLTRRGIPSARSRLHRDVLADLVQSAAGRPGHCQWFLRQSDGSGTARGGYRLAPELEERGLAPGAFPELMLCEDWQDPQAGELVEDFVQWQAPVLLTLPELSRETRRRLEHAAARRALALYAYRNLIPEIVDHTVVDPALVEAVLRRSA